MPYQPSKNLTTNHTKKLFVRLVRFVVIILFVPQVAALDAPVFSGVFNSTLTVGAGAGDLPDFYWGLEEYANLRLKQQVGDRGSVYMAFNLIAAGGVSALALQTGPFGFSGSGNAGDNYAAAMELERLYIHLTGEKTAFDGGLMRLAFGYGSVFSPNDYFNPKNPLYPDARQRAVLAANFTFYPTDMSRLQFFGAAPKDPFKIDGEGLSAGLAAENHWNKFSAQALYSIEAGKKEVTPNAHNFGLSLKADLPVGITADVLWSYKQGESATVEGLAASGGVDYTFSIATHSIYLLAEYLYNGAESKMTGYAEHHYLYGAARLSIDDYTAVTPWRACRSCGQFRGAARFV
jgi:hypothetical protein